MARDFSFADVLSDGPIYTDSSRGRSRFRSSSFDPSGGQRQQTGFTRGFSLGEEAGWKDGYNLGLQRGAQLASERQNFSARPHTVNQCWKNTSYISNFGGWCQEGHPALNSPSNNPMPSMKKLSNANEPEQLPKNLGFYQGFVHAWITVLEREETVKQRKLTALKTLLDMTRSFPRGSMYDDDIMEKLQKIRAKFKQVVALLNVTTEYAAPEEPVNQRTEMSF